MDDESRPSKYLSVREMYAEDECVYIMDAKVRGNIGRYLNVSLVDLKSFLFNFDFSALLFAQRICSKRFR